MLAANGIDRTNTGSAAGAAMEMRRISNKNVWKESKKNLDEIKDSIEQGAEDAAAPKDENGNPINGTTDNTESNTPMPEASGATSVLGEPAAPIQETEMAEPQAPAPAVQSIDIVV